VAGCREGIERLIREANRSRRAIELVLCGGLRLVEPRLGPGVDLATEARNEV
jgi:hypothetical protein